MRDVVRGPTPIRLPKLDAAGLAGPLRDLTGSDASAHAARATVQAQRLRDEDGAGAAAAALGRLDVLG
ncbi:MAG TPA: hypothetical protein GXZ45_04650 [Propionibacterium sp.]|nr:hypothetical protein [Propionibacterium sp.]